MQGWDELLCPELPVSIPPAMGHLGQGQGRVTPAGPRSLPGSGSGSRAQGAPAHAAMNCLCVCQGRTRVPGHPWGCEQGMSPAQGWAPDRALTFLGVPTRAELGKVTVGKPLWASSDNRVSLSLSLLTQKTGEKEVKEL